MINILLLIFYKLFPNIATRFTQKVLTEGVWYRINKEDHTAVVSSSYTGYNGALKVFHYIEYKDDYYEVTTIEGLAFSNCYGLTSLSIEEGIKEIGFASFSNCQKLTKISLPNSIKSIGTFAFEGCIRISLIEFSSNIESIGDAAFRGCRSLVDIRIPKNVKHIGKRAFQNCPNLTSVELPSTIETIEDGMFSGCISLKEITLPSNVKKIGWHVFEGCSQLKCIKILGDLKCIGEYIVNNCNNLSDIYIYSEASVEFFNHVFTDSMLSKVRLHVPNCYLNDYKKSALWGRFMNILPIDNNEDYKGCISFVEVDKL